MEEVLTFSDDITDCALSSRQRQFSLEYITTHKRSNWLNQYKNPCCLLLSAALFVWEYTACHA